MADHIGQQLGNYRLLRVLGQGSFAAVYLGEHLYLERPAAIKVLHVQMEPSSQQTFLQEARTIAHLDHPHIVRVLDFGIEEQIPYLVMDYTPNGTLRTRHPTGTRLSFEQIVSYVRQIAVALDYAHGQHVIHRDVKPENILLTAKGEIVLSDFGIAIVQRTLDTLSGQNMAGTPLYMAPEQIQRHPCPASDQYALGVMVYEWVCGEPPFPGPGTAIFGQHLYQDPPSLCTCVPELPSAVEDVVFRALAKNPARRFPTVQDFATALEEACFATQPLSLPASSESTPQELEDPTVPLSAVRAGLPPSAVRSSMQPASFLAEPQHGVSHHMSAPRSVMCVCAPADRALLVQWEAHLRLLEQVGALTVWSESHLLAGSPRQQQMHEHLEQAALVVVLLSADFFASDECLALMDRALFRQRHGAGQVVPLLLRPVEWQASPLASCSCIPSNGPAVTEWTNSGSAFDWCVRDLCRVLRLPATTVPSLKQTSPAAPVAQRNRNVLLRKVRSFWIEGVLNHSLQGAVLMILGLQTQPDAIANPWHLILQQPETMPHPLPTGTRITQVYDAADGELLILGAPGAGKTTLLLELARDLLVRAQHDVQHPMPVVFNLSSWAGKQQSLVEWLGEELHTKYDVPAPLARTLVETDQILPLLDGLDEIAVGARTVCIEAINTYRQEHGWLPLVVCSRAADYLAQIARVRLGSAVQVQSLRQEQVDTYLAQGGEPLWALRVALHQDAVLRELTSTPLMLSILTLTYHGKPVEELLRDAPIEERQRQIFEQYVRQMLTRRGPLKAGTAQQMVQWLTFLATRMQQHNQTVFYLEHLQPTWLSGVRIRHVYDRWAVRFPAILIGVLVGFLVSFFLYNPNDLSLLVPYGLIGGIIGDMLSEGKATQFPPKRIHEAWRNVWWRLIGSLRDGILLGCGMFIIGTSSVFGIDTVGIGPPICGSIFGVIFGVCGFLLSMTLRQRRPHPLLLRGETPVRSWRKRWLRILQSEHLKNGLLTGGIFIAAATLSDGLIVTLGYVLFDGTNMGFAVGPVAGLRFGLNFGLGVGLIGFLLSLILTRWDGKIRPAEVIHWSWKDLWHHLCSARHVRNSLLLAGLFALVIGTVSEISLMGLGLVNRGLSAILDPSNIGFILSTTWNFGIVGHGLPLGLSVGLGYWFLLGLPQGVSSDVLDDNDRHIPNQGIRNSALNGVRISIITALTIGFVLSLSNFISNFIFPFFLFFPQFVNGSSWQKYYPTPFSLLLSTTLYSPLDSGLGSGLGSGIIGGLIAGLLMGGLSWTQHVTLRFLLQRADAIPWNCTRFLDDATEHILLRKAGGGYLFPHRLLLDYFASCEPSFPEEAPTRAAMNAPAPALSGASQTDSTHQEEKAAPAVLSRKSGFNKEKLVSTLFVALLLLASVASIFSAVQHTLQKVNDAAATAQTAQVEANTTAEAHANTVLIPYPPQNTSPVLNDPLQDNSKGNNWEENTSDSLDDCTFKNRSFDINTNGWELCAAKTTDFTNFIYEVQMKIVKGDWGGIAFRIDPMSSNHFSHSSFVINQNGSYSVDTSTSIDANGNLLAQGSSSAIHQGLNQTNLVAVVVSGTITRLYVNHKRIAVVGSNTFFPHGEIGVIATSSGNQTEVTFQNANVWKL
jgi:serine/threonine protein kinase